LSRELDRGRERFERSLADLRDVIEDELGAVPRVGRWALAIGAAAAGFVLGGVLARRVAGRRRRPSAR
jgi:hypothetical protein